MEYIYTHVILAIHPVLKENLTIQAPTTKDLI